MTEDDLIEEIADLEREITCLNIRNEVLIAALKFYAEEGGYLSADANQGHAQNVLDELDIEWTDLLVSKRHTSKLSEGTR
jgi:hypothetical protein